MFLFMFVDTKMFRIVSWINTGPLVLISHVPWLISHDFKGGIGTTLGIDIKLICSENIRIELSFVLDGIIFGEQASSQSRCLWPRYCVKPSDGSTTTNRRHIRPPPDAVREFCGGRSPFLSTIKKSPKINII